MAYMAMASSIARGWLFDESLTVTPHGLYLRKELEYLFLPSLTSLCRAKLHQTVWFLVYL